MLFTNPATLWALTAILIPIVIHLFHFRIFKKTYFSNVALLKNIQNQTQKQSKLKHLLVLGCRILTFIFIVLAFAQPHPKTALKPIVGNGTNYVSVAIDNSFSMGTQTGQGTLLDQAKQKATDLVKKFKPSDRFMLISQNFLDDNRRFVSQEEVLDAIERIDIVPFSHPLSELSARQKSVFATISEGDKILFQISDFQRTMLDAGMMVSDTVLQTWLCPVQSNMQTNISLDSLFIETPVFQVGNEMEFQLEVTNYGEQALQAIPLKLVVNDKLVSVGNVDLEPHQTKSVQRKLTLQEAGYVQGYFEISDYPVTFDDKLFFTLNVLEQIPVLWITEGVPNPFLMKLLSQDKGFDLNIQEVRNLDYSLLNKVNFVILDELKTLSSGLQTELKTAINAGLAVLILPSEQSDITSVNNLTNETLNTVYSPIETAKLRVETILSEHSIFRSAFVKLPEAMLLPEVNKRFPIQISTRSTAQYLLRLNNDEPFLAFGNVGKGRIYLSSVPFNNDFSNFQNQPIFVVTVLNMLVQSVNNEHIYNILNQQEAVVSNVKNVPVSEIFYLKLQDSDFEVIPQVKFSGNQLFIDTYSTLKQAGNYSLQTPNDTVAELSYNFDRRESDLQSYSPSELNQILKDHGLEGFAILEDQFISSDNPILLAEEGVFWWKWCLLLALLFVLAEICVLRLL